MTDRDEDWHFGQAIANLGEINSVIQKAFLFLEKLNLTGWAFRFQSIVLRER